VTFAQGLGGASALTLPQKADSASNNSAVIPERRPRTWLGTLLG
jgi:hypothetical protein